MRKENVKTDRNAIQDIRRTTHLPGNFIKPRQVVDYVRRTWLEIASGAGRNERATESDSQRRWRFVYSQSQARATVIKRHRDRKSQRLEPVVLETDCALSLLRNLTNDEGTWIILESM